MCEEKVSRSEPYGPDDWRELLACQAAFCGDLLFAITRDTNADDTVTLTDACATALGKLLHAVSAELYR